MRDRRKRLPQEVSKNAPRKSPHAQSTHVPPVSGYFPPISEIESESINPRPPEERTTTIFPGRRSDSASGHGVWLCRGPRIGELHSNRDAWRIAQEPGRTESPSASKRQKRTAGPGDRSAFRKHEAARQGR